MNDDDFTFISLEKSGISDELDGYNLPMAQYRVDFIYLGLHGHGIVNISDTLATDPQFDLIDIATDLVKGMLKRKEDEQTH